MTLAARFSSLTRLAIVASILSAPLAASAQVAHPLVTLRAGERVRVWTNSPVEQIGTLTAIVGDTLRVQGGDRSFIILRPAIARLDVQRGTRRSVGAIVVGILLGSAVGTLVGSYAGVLIECSGSCDSGGEYEGLAGGLAGAALGFIAGGAAGGIIGGQRRIPSWERVLPP